MDLMELRRGLLAQMAGAKVKTGTFTGNGTATVALDIGFEPDVVIIDSGHYYNNAGFTGMLFTVIVRGVVVFNCQHQSDTATNSPMYGNPVGENADIWGADSTISYTSYASYDSGTLTISNKNPVANQAKFKNGNTYNWTAYKA